MNDDGYIPLTMHSIGNNKKEQNYVNPGYENKTNKNIAPKKEAKRSEQKPIIRVKKQRKCGKDT